MIVLVIIAGVVLVVLRNWRSFNRDEAEKDKMKHTYDDLVD